MNLATEIADVTCCGFCGTTNAGLILIVIPPDEGFALPTRHIYTLGICRTCDDKPSGGSIVGRLVQAIARGGVTLTPGGTK